ncbi:N-succinylarginine dihydrolase [Gynuella sunshinyii]|uniref:N-succinylarginine dihydrolase n=1 Tax=Gynuella sunshinyii YC6258 TaxID=1445510 RepID=A0A0C5VWD7_9GAMM|nr:N-succinylarginine dihydrolase [Gynuella sunshinyii]AJQ97628.1 succinylarginine dihydrolase [Gynuella sunshinyii YC6258]
MSVYEVNFDGLVGPTHSYAGLSYGNVASARNVAESSNPKQAALQGLAKMKQLHDAGFKQGILLPHERPYIPVLKQLGFSGTEASILQLAARQAPELLAAASSASCMWTANAATVSPSADTHDGRVHFTAANLNNKFHRSIEHPLTSRMLQAIFAEETVFAHHPALPAVSQFGDEGAANHTRLCVDYGQPGVELFVYGQHAFNYTSARPTRYPARQTLEASQAIARLHGLEPQRTVFAQQAPNAIDAGVFHNDVIAVGNREWLFYHEEAFLNEAQLLQELEEKLGLGVLKTIRVSGEQVPLNDVIHSYLFNSQLLSRPDGSMVLVVPLECREIASVSVFLDQLVGDTSNPINELLVFDLKQSMKNGGGPACLRLRVVLTEDELAAVHSGCLLTDELFGLLNAWVNKHYRDRLSFDDLSDPALLQESRTALDELTGLLNLGSIYDFQRV